MTIQLELDPTLKANLVAEARAHGQAPERYAEGLLQNAFRGVPNQTITESEEDFESFLNAMEVDVPDTSTLRAETFDRDSFTL